MKYQIKKLGLAAPVQRRGIKPGTLMPAPTPLADKPGGKKGKPIVYDNDALTDLFALNGGNMQVFRFITRIGGWLFNAVSNKHLIGLLKGLLPKWIGKFANSYVPYPLPKGKVALAEKIYCEGNPIEVDQVKGQWVHVKAGIATLTQVYIGTSNYVTSSVRWRVPAGWLEKSLVERI